jgi:glycine/D-amino acid oxidase-like deaminating enzyme
MAEIVVAGAGICGLAMAMLLAKDGHTVTVLERDPEPPPAAEEAWAGWQRKGVNQFRLPHFFLARFRILLEAELPEVLCRVWPGQVACRSGAFGVALGTVTGHSVAYQPGIARSSLRGMSASHGDYAYQEYDPDTNSTRITPWPNLAARPGRVARLMAALAW